MTDCPKCPAGHIPGPFYRDHGTGGRGTLGECLLYRCSTCGYEETRPCADKRTVMGGPDALADVIRAAQSRKLT